jgi:CTP synthase (UTP-ammonia lyase)
VVGIADADSAEHETLSKNLIIAPVVCPVPDRRNGAPKLSGPCRLRIQPGCRLAAIYGANEVEEEYFCNFEVNPDYIQEFSRAGMRLSAFGQDEELRAAELPDHAFFIATLFQPQLSSTEQWAHPLIVEYLATVAARQA